MEELNSKRIKTIEENLHLQFDLLSGYENRLSTVSDPREILRCSQEVKRIKEDITQFTYEYSQITFSLLLEKNQQLALGEKGKNFSELRTILSSRELSIDGKLELILPIIPGLLSYKTELGVDLRNMVSKAAYYINSLLSKNESK